MSGQPELKVIAFDPGRTIGFARIHLCGQSIKLFEADQELSSIKVKGNSERWYAYESTPVRWVYEWKPNVVQIEDFIGGGLRSNDSSNVLRMVGGLYEAAYRVGADVRLVTPGERYPFFSLADKLCETIYGSKLKYELRHSRDALAHALMAIERTPGFSAHDLVWSP